MTNREKRFLTYDNQITLLKRQGMIVSDENAARDILEQIGFYELVNGYKAIFKRDGHGNYLPGTTFEELYALYKCDENLRQLFLKYMLRVEIHMRSLLSYAFCERFGHEQSAYLTRENYDTEGPAADEINRLIGELDYAANRADKAVYVCHHRKRYGNVPLWVLFKTLSIGTLIRFLRCCKPEIREEVAAHFPDLREKTLCRMLDLMQDFRNVCAHNDCLYAYHGQDTIPLMPAVRSTSASPIEISAATGSALAPPVTVMVPAVNSISFAMLVMVSSSVLILTAEASTEYLPLAASAGTW